MTETVKAIKCYSGYTCSSVASGSYTITPPCDTPAASPGAGSYVGTQNVSFTGSTCTGAGSFACVTTDGSTPTGSSSGCTNGTSVSYGNTFAVSTSETVKAIMEQSGYASGSVASFAYTITSAAMIRRRGVVVR